MCDVLCVGGVEVVFGGYVYVVIDDFWGSVEVFVEFFWGVVVEYGELLC